jgi:hypothetical protein
MARVLGAGIQGPPDSGPIGPRRIFVDRIANAGIIVQSEGVLAFPLPSPTGAWLIQLPCLQPDTHLSCAAGNAGHTSAEDWVAKQITCATTYHFTAVVVTDRVPVVPLRIASGTGAIKALFCPDLSQIAIQRTEHEIEVHGALTVGQPVGTFSCARTPNLRQDRRILDWWWLAPHSLLIVTTANVEVYAVGEREIGGTDQRPASVDKVDASWCRFDPISQVVVIATGKSCSTLRIFRLNTRTSPPGQSTRSNPSGRFKELQRLPNIEIDLRSAAAGGRGRQPIERNEVLVVPLYNSIYVIRIDKIERKLVLYAIGAAARPLEIKLFSQSDHLEISVIDNVLVLHDMGAQQSMMYDVKLSVNFPVIPPFGLLGPDPDSSQSVQLYTDSWIFEQPYFVLDSMSGRVYNVRRNFNQFSACTAGSHVHCR